MVFTGLRISSRQQLFLDQLLLNIWGDTSAQPITFIDDVWIVNLYNNGTASFLTVEAYAARLANSMTNYIRILPQKDQMLQFIHGQAFNSVTYIQVQLAWLSFPAGLLVLTISFLVLTIWRMKKQRHDQCNSEKGLSKSSSLAVSFVGLNEHAKWEYSNIDKKSSMIDCAG